jgi:uncharacterized protein (DUF305 family)
MKINLTHNNSMNIKIARSIASLSVLGIILVGCSSDTSMDMGDVGDTSAMSIDAQDSNNMADIAFAQMMIPHHEQAVVMSQYALTNTENAQVLALAQEILDAQGPEIEQMNAILSRFDAGMGGHGGHTMAGMATEDELTSLQAARGAEFDRLFLAGMIAHHVGAIEMADDVLAAGADPEVRALAETIVPGQQAEIDVMQKLLAN